jgi:hypothetical protein
MKKILFISIILLSSCSSKYKNKTIADVFNDDPSIITIKEEEKEKEDLKQVNTNTVIKTIKQAKPTEIINAQEIKNNDGFKFNLKNEVVKYKAFAVGLHAGDATISILPDKLINNQRVLHFSLQMETSYFFSKIYLLKSKIDSYVNKTNFKPIKYVQSSIEGDNTKLFIETINYDSKTSHVFKKYNDKIEKNEEKNIDLTSSNLSDLLQIIFHIRNNLNEERQLNVINNQKIKKVSIQKIGNEVIEIDDKKYSTVKFKVINNNKSQFIWINPMDNNKIVKIEISLPFGSGYLTIID